MQKILGLDIGTNSIGWALVSEDACETPILGLGTRIFLEAVNPKNRVPTNAARRAARMQRKIIARRASRKRGLLKLLVQLGLLPSDAATRNMLFAEHSKNPYALRKAALDGQIELHELGRVLYHLSSHRGYKSNRKAMMSSLVTDPDVAAVIEEEAMTASTRKKGGAKSEEEEGKVLKAIAQLELEMQEAGARTLGEFQADRILQGGRARRGIGDSANYTRELVESEFDQIFNVQAKFHHELTPQVRAGIYRAIFYQRPLKIQRFLIAKCKLEPTRQCARKAYPIAQEFRIAQMVANMRVFTDHLSEGVPLTPEQMHVARQVLNDHESVTWSSFKKSLGLKNAEINFERMDDKALGNKTNARLKSRLGEFWTNLPNIDKANPGQRKDKEAFIHDLLCNDRLDTIIKRLRTHWGLSPEQAYKAATVEFDNGTVNLSVKAMVKILPHLLDGDNIAIAKAKAGYEHTEVDVIDLLGEAPKTRNPVVDRALVEVRKVVNAVCRVYGKPDVIRIEMARELKLTKKEKEEVERQNKRNKVLNDEAREKIKEAGLFRGVEPSKADLVKYRLWVESDEHCPYTGRKIALAQLFSGEVDVEHIIPYSRSLDDSFRNKTICDAGYNQAHKRNKTPREACTDEELEAILTRLASFKRMRDGKKNLFKLQWSPEMEQGFTNRHLVDTGYICRTALSYVAPLVGPMNAQVSKGQLTAILRELWGLDTILHPDGKNRDDHRHHAVDALVVALTSRSLLQRISRQSAIVGSAGIGDGQFAVEPPIPNLRSHALEWVEKIIVSHQTSQKVSGAIHEDTVYGRIGSGEYVSRKPVAKLTDGEIARVRDKHLRSELTKIGAEELKKRPLERPFVFFDRYGVERVVRSVRITHQKKDETMLQTGAGFHPTGSNQHVEIFENADGDRRYRIVSVSEARRRIRSRVPIVNDHYEREAGFRFIGTWHTNDTVTVDGRVEGFYRVVLFSPLDNEKKAYILLRPVRNAVETKEKKAPSTAASFADVLCQSPDNCGRISPAIPLSVLGHLRESSDS